MLKIINIQKSFANQAILKGVNLETEPGLLTILEGQNGAGKSTLFNILSGSLSQDQGHILLNGADISSGAITIAILKQDPKQSSAPNLSVLENLVLFMLNTRPPSLQSATRAQNRQRAIEHLENLGLERENLDLPMGQLSGGQRQILAFAMVTLTRPHLILLDEPTAALDEKTSHMLMKLIKKLVAQWQIPALMISHDHGLNQIYGDKIVVLRDGALGSPLAT